jgi:hypothetical protein
MAIKNCVICGKPIPASFGPEAVICSVVCSTVLSETKEREREIEADVREANRATLEDDEPADGERAEPQSEIPVWIENAVLIAQLAEALAVCADPKVASEILSVLSGRVAFAQSAASRAVKGW